MKKYNLKIFFIGIFLFLSISCSFAQELTTQGKRFWVAFMNNYGDLNSELSLIVSAKKACSGTIQNPSKAWSVPFSVGDDGITQITVPANVAKVEIPHIIDQLSLLVESTDTISLYASNFEPHSFDVSGILPEASLGEEYIAQTYNVVFGNDNSQILIVATEDNTIIDITPSTSTTGGHKSNVTFNINLNKGDTYMLSSNDNLSGTKIKAHDCKKIAVFNGNKATQVPSGYGNLDHLYEQAFPKSTWGKKFVATTSLGQPADRIRITASANDTKIYIDGTYKTTIQEGKSYEFEIASSKKACFIETSNPSAVFTYLVGMYYGIFRGKGDPSMVWIPPIEQRINEITFGAFDTSVTKEHSINIVANTSDISTITLDGDNINEHFKPVSANPTLSYAQMDIAHGAHTIKSENGFLAHVYGLGERESYAYSVGSNAIKLNSQITLNDITFAELPASENFCKNEMITFKALLEYTPKSIVWKTSDGTTFTGNVFTYSFGTPGNYTIEMTAERQNSSCDGSLFDIISIEITVVGTRSYTLDETICKGSHYTLNGKQFNTPGTYYETISSHFCDSIVTLNLSVDTIKTVLYDNVCFGEEYDKYGFSLGLQNKSGMNIYQLDLKTNEGCDSLVLLNLQVFDEIKETYLHDEICLGESYNKHGFDIENQESTGTFLHSLILKSINNCDSIIKLNLKVKGHKETLLKDTICLNETYTKYGFNIKEQNLPGLFDFSLNLDSEEGCDSIVKLDLFVLEEPTLTQLNDTVCLNEHYAENGFSIAPHTQVGIYNYKLNLYSIHGCDSIVSLDLFIPQKLENTILKDTICLNEAYGKNGFSLPPQNTIGISQYQLTLNSYLGCDSIVELNLHVMPHENTEINDTVCKNETYNKNGFSLGNQQNSGCHTHYLNLSSSHGCDSIVCLKLYVLDDLAPTVLFDEICQYDYYDKHGFSLGKQDESGLFMHQLSLNSTMGCDSIVVLNLTVKPQKMTFIQDEICEFAPYNKNGFNIETHNSTGKFNYQINLPTSDICDSIVNLTLNVLPSLRISIDENIGVCTDDYLYTINYQINTGKITSISIEYDQKAIEQGFVNEYNIVPNDNNFITLKLPENIRPDIYDAYIRFYDEKCGNQTEHPIHISIYYPSSIIAQKWNDVLALRNSDHNGGYEFSDYQWYVNGEIIPGAIFSYVYLPDILDFNAEYTVSLTRIDDNITLFTCPFIPSFRDDIKIYPSLLSANGMITIESKKNIEVKIFDLSGRKVSETMLSKGINKIKAPSEIGTYILQAKTSEEEKKTITILLK